MRIRNLAMALTIGLTACKSPAEGQTVGTGAFDSAAETATGSDGSALPDSEGADAEPTTADAVDCSQVFLRVSAAGNPSKLLFVKFAATDGKPKEKTVQLVHGGTVPSKLVKASLESDASFEFRLGSDAWQGPGLMAPNLPLTPGTVVDVSVRWTPTGGTAIGQLLLSADGCSALKVDVRGEP